MAGIFATNTECEYKAGANVNPTASGATLVDSFLGQAESFINVLTKYNFSDVYATGLNADIKAVLTEAASNLAAMYMIQYDMSGYTTRIEAEDMINILWARFKQCIELLENQDKITFMKGA